MDKRRKKPDMTQQLERRERLLAEITAGTLDVPAGIRRMREAAFLTRDEYARLVGVAPRALAQIELGRANPTLATLEKIGKPFGLKIGYRLKAGKE